MTAADQVASGDYSIRVIERGPPAVRALARAFNRMTDRLAQHDIARRDLMAEIAHELRTPLTVMQGRLEGLLDGVYARDDSSLEQVLDDTRVLARLVEDLRTLALSEAGVLRLELELTDPAVLVHDAVTGFAPQAAAAHVALAAEIAGSLPAVELDPVRIGQVLRNLIANAITHTPVEGRVDVRARATSDGGVEVTVQDTGQGMTPADLDRMFERFQKGAASRGSGLGLTIARNLVVAHAGTISATSVPDRGTTICVTLPGAQP
jgi:two-component system OmpR family sensor kinase/two-component system sensor histidine kinase BaeS